MNVYFRQCYIEPGAEFPFSHYFQRRLSREITSLVEPSSNYLQKYSPRFNVTFNVSAKKGISENEIRGPTVFKKTHDVEFTVFLPFDAIMRRAEVPKAALSSLLKGVCDVFDSLEIDKAKILDEEASIISSICADATMVQEPHWDEQREQTPVRKRFRAFFSKR